MLVVPIVFVKMHGIGNDFVVIGALDDLPLPEEKLSEFARFVCDRHFGVGADGVIWILPSQVADFKMRIFNPDGSEAEMCGNGIRCAAKWFYDRDYAKGKAVQVETLAGIKTVWVQEENGKAVAVTVDMGEPIFAPSLVPTSLGEGSEAIDNFPVETIGPRIEHHPAFPKRTNVEFVQVLSRNEMKVRVWERGAGLTLACGTGACASLVIASRTGRTDRKAKVHLPGGTLTIEWRDDGRIYMTGPAVEVFRGEFVWESD